MGVSHRRSLDEEGGGPKDGGLVLVGAEAKRDGATAIARAVVIGHDWVATLLQRREAHASSRSAREQRKPAAAAAGGGGVVGGGHVRVGADVESRDNPGWWTSQSSSRAKGSW